MHQQHLDLQFQFGISGDLIQEVRLFSHMDSVVRCYLDAVDKHMFSQLLMISFNDYNTYS